MRPLHTRSAVLLLAAAIAGPAAAGPLDEVRLGLLAHDVPILGPQYEHGLDVNGELLFTSPVQDAAVTGVGQAWRWLLQPRIDLGITANTAGQTSEVYAGLTWTPLQVIGPFGLPGMLFLDFSFGPGLNNGHIYSGDRPRLSLGANLLFRESIELGYRFVTGVGVSVYFDHSSNGGIDTYNDGLNNLGVRVGYKF